MPAYSFELFADYYQFYLRDEQAEGDLSPRWTEEATRRFLATAPGTIGIGTVRNVQIPVAVEVRDDDPTCDLAQWDHVVECSIDTRSGRIVVAGCTDYLPSAARITVTPGSYRARVFWGGLDTLNDDGLKGNDHYKVVLWPAPASGVVVVKQWQDGDDVRS